MSSEWAHVPLSELTEAPATYGVVQPGQNLPTGLPMLRVNNFRGHSLDLSEVMRIAPEIEAKYERTRIKTGDVLLTIVGSVGQVAVVSGELDGWNIARAVALIRPRESELSRWISLVLRSPKAQYQLGVAANTTVQTTINLKDLRELSIPFPGNNERKAIAHILGTLDDKIELNRRMNETLEEMASALFKAWFVDFEPVRAKLEGRWQRGQSLPGLPAHLFDLFPDHLVDSELGRIPKGWEVSALGKVCSYLNRGISPKYIDRGGVSVLNQKCIRNFSIDFSKARRHDVAQKKIDGRALELGDVLVNSTGVGTLGRVAQVRRLAETTIVDSHVTVVRSGARINPMYLGYFMGMKQPEIEAMGEGSTGQTELSRTKLGALSILLPTDEVLSHFAKQTKTISESIAANQADSEALAQIRDTLLPNLISGELRVPDAELIVGAAV